MYASGKHVELAKVLYITQHPPSVSNNGGNKVQQLIRTVVKQPLDVKADRDKPPDKNHNVGYVHKSPSLFSIYVHCNALLSTTTIIKYHHILIQLILNNPSALLQVTAEL